MKLFTTKFKSGGLYEKHVDGKKHVDNRHIAYLRTAYYIHTEKVAV